VKKRLSVALIFIFTVPLLLGMAPSAPYNTYNFNPVDDSAHPMLDCMVPVRVITGIDLGAGDLDKPNDFRFGLDGRAYIADTNNDRILVLDSEFNLLRIIDGFYYNNERHTFNAPEGVFAEEDGTIFIADTQNRRIVVLDADGSLHTLMDNVELTGSMITFRPQKVVTDTAGHVYVVGAGSTEGLIQLTRNGEFVRFFGSNRVRPNPIEVVYRMFLTRAQRQAREQFIPTEFSNAHVDEMGFLYVTTRNTRTLQVRRLNAMGGDVLRHDGIGGEIYGDITSTTVRSGTMAQFQAVSTDSDGNVYALDNSTGRVFVYSNNGYMLFMFGGRGNQMGLFSDAQAVEVRDGTAYVLCAGRGNLTVFELTDYGRKLLLANHLYTLGEYEASIEPWEEVLRMDAGNTGAWYALGQAYYGRKDYAAAMECFKLGMNRTGYSLAFGQLRNEWFKRYFSPLVIGLILLIVAVNVSVRLFKRAKRRKKS
jgi:DNA-binding beta-propeller fold protein YncE